MSNLLSTTGERVYFKDLMSRFLFVSAGWIEAYAPGRDAGELTGQTDFNVFTEEHASAAFADEQQIIRTGEPVVGHVERETYTGRPDAWVSTAKMALRDERGGYSGEPRDRDLAGLLAPPPRAPSRPATRGRTGPRTGVAAARRPASSRSRPTS